MDLTQIRKRIDRIDSEFSRLFVERLEVSKDVAEYKRATGKPIYDRTRERENIAAASNRVPPEYASYAAVIQSVLMEASREAQHKALGRRSDTAQRIGQALESSPAFFPLRPRVACQGVEGAYQQIACDRMFRHPSIDFHPTFEGVLESVECGEADFGVLPIENSTAGSVNHVYDLMMRHEFYIVRSCRLKIDHNLLVRPGTTKEDVRIVYSHQQAINQCADYLATIPNCRVHVCENTARAAQMVSESDRDDVAALASRSCAELYGLHIAEQSVQDNQNNYTRFACIARDLTIYPGAERSSLMVVVNHEPGALYNVLARFYALDINLVKLESRPIANRDFEFMFYFDIECPAAAPEFGVLMDSLDDVCEQWRYLGSYTEVV
ncbi:MAG: bifunctional chorismate mutase/prephenate dehydratase [Coriobacteriales bacterium]|nr:bifunctional chorismate mutase/prephenate dehydratase [Coriobacteriales bacterium]